MKNQEFKVRCMNQPSEAALERWYKTCIRVVQLAAKEREAREANSTQTQDAATVTQ